MTDYEKAMLVIAIIGLVIDLLTFLSTEEKSIKKPVLQRDNSGRAYIISFTEASRSSATSPFAIE